MYVSWIFLLFYPAKESLPLWRLGYSIPIFPIHGPQGGIVDTENAAPTPGRS